MREKKKYAVILAAGVGSRLGAQLPKQFLPVGGRMMIWWSLKAFRSEDPTTEILIVLHPDYFDFWRSETSEWPEELTRGVRLVAGGNSRRESVSNALREIPDGRENLVAIHDGARPMVTPEIIRAGWQLLEEHEAGVPAIPVADSLRKREGESNHFVDRSDFVAVQTPQVFTSDVIHRAYSQLDQDHFTDDASVVEAMGTEIVLFPGSPSNFKVTYPVDITIADTLLRQ